MNIIDTLVIELGFDVEKLSSQQQDAVDSLRKFENAARRNLKPAQEGIDGLVNSFSLLQGRLLAIGGLIAAGLGFNRLVQDVTKLNSETGYLAKNLGVSAQELSKWQAAGATVGANAGEIASSFASIRKSMAEFQLTGNSQLNAFAYTTHQTGQGPAVELYDAKGKWRDPTDILLSISRWAEAQENKAVATQMISKLGLGEGMTNLLMQGPNEVQKRLAQGEKFAPSDDQIKKLQELQKAFGEVMVAADALKTQFVSALAPALTKILNLVSDWLGTWTSKKQSIPEAGGEALGKMGLPELAPNTKMPSLAERSWNWMLGRPGGFHPESVPGYHTRGSQSGTGTAPGTGGAGTSDSGGGFMSRFGNWMSGDGGTRPAPPAQAGAGGAGGRAGAGGAGGSGGAPGAPGAAGGAGSDAVGTGRFDRSSFQREIDQNPELADRLQTIVQGEVGHRADRDRQLIQMETIFNRAAARGQTLDEVTQQYTGPGSRGYYPASTFAGGAIQSDAERQRFRAGILNPALAGSDRSTEVLGFPATGNASAGVAARGAASGRYTRFGQINPNHQPGQAGVETYVQEGNWGRGGRTREDIARLESTRIPNPTPANQNTAAAPARSLPSWLPGVAANANEAGSSRSSYAPESPRATGTDGAAAGGPGSFNDLWSNRIGLGSRGAVMSGDTNTNTSTSTTQTTIGEMHITPPPGGDPRQYGAGIREELQRYDNVQHSNTGLE